VSFTQGGAPSYEGGISVGTPLIADKLGLRVTAYQRHDGGYIDRVDPLSGAMVQKNADWQDTTALRGALTLAPVETVKITPSIYYQNVYSNTKSAVWGYLSNPGQDVYKTGAQTPEPTRDRIILPALDISVGLGAVTLFEHLLPGSQDGGTSELLELHSSRDRPGDAAGRVHARRYWLHVAGP
jgi:hypothetical protein